ncbi:hypothetical protein BLNAU_12495 [Blattamonas nauphoetae]|uniref:Uncharacterized protein n=1 Tax=Blattamonas nauphoetae TaxID=2049346 RepID=A0ABQ9XMU2_9EUKA|nr:hypothetical protein BLNAU_12495 [Blattamonas nauphoetae]
MDPTPSTSNQSTPLENFINELLKIDDFEVLATLLNENIDHDELGCSVLRIITMLPERMKTQNPSLSKNVPLLSPESILPAALADALSIPPFAEDAFDAIYNLLSYHPLDSILFRAHQSFLLSAGLLPVAVSVFDPEYLSEIEPSSYSDVIESGLDAIELLIHNHPIAQQEFHQLRMTESFIHFHQMISSNPSCLSDDAGALLTSLCK